MAATGRTFRRTKQRAARKPLSPSFVMGDAILNTVDASGEPIPGQAWDTVTDSGSWQLGVVRKGRLLNRSDSSIPVVPINTTMGGVRFFAADSGYFRSGQTFKLTMLNPEDALIGITASPGSMPAYVPVMEMTYLGVTGDDMVGNGETALSPDGSPDGVIRLRMAPGKRPFTITGIRLRASDERGTIVPPIAWDTTPGNGTWALGVYRRKGGQSDLLNKPDGSLRTAVQSPTDFYVYFSSPTDADFFSSFPLFKVTLSLGRRRFVDIGIPTDPGSSLASPGLSFEYAKMTEDMVRPGKKGIGSDGRPDGEFRLRVL